VIVKHAHLGLALVRRRAPIQDSIFVISDTPSPSVVVYSAHWCRARCLRTLLYRWLPQAMVWTMSVSAKESKKLKSSVCGPSVNQPMGSDVSLIRFVDFQILGDERGSLVAIEQGDGNVVPFEIKRVYYIYKTSLGVSRGFHAHRNLQQVAICVAGSCRMVLDDGFKREEVILDCPTKGLLIQGLLWREMHDFSDNCVLLVLASEHYDESDYIRDYSCFKDEATKKD
jgi:dTDP-4-dehydrorhamnose 3,5-epimerase-like enzyme